MARLTNIRGMILEELLLHLLESTGYSTVLVRGDDPTLKDGPAGLKVKGRGGAHQIDAIADFRITHPFSHPQRLLVEAKCFRPSEAVGIEIVRAAVGTLKDVGEHWVATRGSVPKERYHYQYAMFSATGFTRDAQRYAFAQDIYLIPLGESEFLAPVIEALRQVRPTDGRANSETDIRISMKDLRAQVRRNLRRTSTQELTVEDTAMQGVQGLGQFLARARRIRFALMAVLGKRFPVFLVLAPIPHFQGFQDEYRVRIFRGPEDRRWFLRDEETNRDLFSFDLPKELFLRHAKQGLLSPEAALDLKQEAMSTFHAFAVRQNDVRLIRFRLDQNWISVLRNQLRGSG